MDISEVAKASGLRTSTLRFYEEKGLIEPTGRSGLRRQYKPGVVKKLALISLARSAGFSLEEIGEMFPTDQPEIDRQRLLDKADELEQKINELMLVKDYLHHVAECRAPSHFECPQFNRLLHMASKNRLKKPTGLGQ